jgi:peptidoglycan/LPS O-acetylase OafA/YrhL
MFFYLVFALALLLKVRIIPFVGAVLGACLALSFFRQPDWPAWTVYADVRVFDFFAGMVIAAYAERVRLSVSVSALMIVAGFAGIAFLPDVNPFVTPILPACVAVVGVVALERPLHGRFPPVLIFLGAASYSLYLVHPLIAPAAPALLAKLHVSSETLSVLGSVAFALTGAIAIYKLMEEPLTRLLNRHIKAFYSRPLTPEDDVGAQTEVKAPMSAPD